MCVWIKRVKKHWRNLNFEAKDNKKCCSHTAMCSWKSEEDFDVCKKLFEFRWKLATTCNPVLLQFLAVPKILAYLLPNLTTFNVSRRIEGADGKKRSSRNKKELLCLDVRNYWEVEWYDVTWSGINSITERFKNEHSVQYYFIKRSTTCWQCISIPKYWCLSCWKKATHQM